MRQRSSALYTWATRQRARKRLFSHSNQTTKLFRTTLFSQARRKPNQRLSLRKIKRKSAKKNVRISTSNPAPRGTEKEREKNEMLEKKLVRRFQNKDKRRFKTSFCFLFMFFLTKFTFLQNSDKKT